MTNVDVGFQAEATAARREHIELLREIYDLRSKANAATRAERGLTERLRQYLDLEGLNELSDDERGLVARLQEREGWEQDLRNMPADVLAALLAAGALRFDNKLVEALVEKAPTTAVGEALKYRRRIIASTALLVEVQK